MVLNSCGRRPRYDIKSGAVSINTNLVKSVGGLPKAGDWVQIKIIRQNSQTRMIEVLSYAELEAVKLISLQSQSGEQIKHATNKNGGILASESESKPAIATFDAKRDQVEALLSGEYGGELHMIMLPVKLQDDDLQESLYEDRLKRAIERKKKELEEQSKEQLHQPGGEANEIRR
ncbi:UNVERIFIED_CONTAM: Flp pilus assembly protein RcpC/CpaB [Acetivibrio alkalicellulosi]